MKGMIGVIITVVIMAVLGGVYWFLGRTKLETQYQEKLKISKTNEATLAKYAADKAQIPEYQAQLPRWQRQFELFRAAIPVELDDDIFLRNLDEELRANNVRMSHFDLRPSGPWMPNLNDTQEQNFKKENMNPIEIRAVKVANFTVVLSGNYGDVLRSFENLKRNGRVFAIEQIISPAGGTGGTVFQNESAATTPIQVSGKIFYGLSEAYLSQETLAKYFGQAETLGAAAGIATSLMHRADELSENPGSQPQPMPAISGAKTSGAAGTAAPGKAPAAGSAAPGKPGSVVPGRPPAAGAQKGAPAAGAGSASSGSLGGKRLAQVNKSHNRQVAAGG